MKSKPLFDTCDYCEGKGITETTMSGDGDQDIPVTETCFVCKGEKYLPSGLNLGQVNKLIADNKNYRAALTFVKEQLEECPQPTAENGYQGEGVQDWINIVHAIALDALEG